MTRIYSIILGIAVWAVSMALSGCTDDFRFDPEGEIDGSTRSVGVCVAFEPNAESQVASLGMSGYIGDANRSNPFAHPLMLRAWRMAGVPTNIDSDTARVLAYIEACGKPVDTRDIALGLHISHASAESAVASLAATGLAAFIYRDGSFRIVPA